MWDTDKATKRKEPTQEGEESKIWQAGENIKQSHEKKEKFKTNTGFWNWDLQNKPRNMIKIPTQTNK